MIFMSDVLQKGQSSRESLVLPAKHFHENKPQLEPQPLLRHLLVNAA